MSENSLSPTLLQKKRLLRKALPGLRRRYGVGDLWLFGSHVRGEENEESDLDVLVTFDNPHLTLIEFIQLELELSELLDTKVDLVERDTLKPTIGQQVLQELVAV